MSIFRTSTSANKALHRTAICTWDLPWSFFFICPFVAVGELDR